MKLAKFLIISLLSVFLLGLVNAELGIDEPQLDMWVDAKVDGKSDNDLRDGSVMDREAEPESTVKITVFMENLYNKDAGEDYDIEEIEIIATLEAIDDEGDEDIELEGDIRKITPGRTGKETFTFKIPLIVEGEDDDGIEYNLNIEVESFDDEKSNATIEDMSMSLTLLVKKEKHKAIISRAELSKNNLECLKSTSLNVEMMNLGREDEEEAVLEIVNDELGINVKDQIELDAGIDDDSRYNKLITIDTADLEPGTYPITIRAYYDKDKSADAIQTVELVVLECVEEEDEEPIVVNICGNNKVETGEECDDGNAVSGDGCSVLCKIETGTTPTGYTPITVEESFWGQYGTTVMIIAGELVFLFIILIIVVVALRKR